jgi:hypothetical protein
MPRRGAPPGNLNALKHGFYSRGFRSMDINDLDSMLTVGLESEINMLRVSTRRLLELSQENGDVDTGIKLLSVLGMTATRLANLMRSQSIIGGGAQDDTLDSIIRALKDLNQEMCK